MFTRNESRALKVQPGPAICMAVFIILGFCAAAHLPVAADPFPLPCGGDARNCPGETSEPTRDREAEHEELRIWREQHRKYLAEREAQRQADALWKRGEKTVNRALALYEKGNRAFSAGKYQGSISLYRAGLKMLQSNDRGVAFVLQDNPQLIPFFQSRIMQVLVFLGATLEPGTPTFDPEAHITKEVYELALQERQRLTELEEKLENKIREVRFWRGDLAGHQREYAALRADAWRGALADIVCAIPGEKIARGVASSPYAQYLDDDFASKFEAAVDAGKGIVSIVDGSANSHQSDDARAKRIAEGSLSIQKALATIPDTPANRNLRIMLKGSLATLDAVTKSTAYIASNPSADWVESGLRLAQTAGDIWGAFDEGVASAIGVTQVALRGAQWTMGYRTASRLGDEIANNWNAELHLQDRLADAQELVTINDRIIAAYGGQR